MEIKEYCGKKYEMCITKNRIKLAKGNKKDLTRRIRRVLKNKRNCPEDKDAAVKIGLKYYKMI